MKVLIVEKDKEPYPKNIPNNLDRLRKILKDEEIEVVEYKDVLLIYNENGLRKNIPINRYINEKAIRGIFIFSGNDTKNMDFKDLTEEQIENLIKEFSLEQEVELDI